MLITLIFYQKKNCSQQLRIQINVELTWYFRISETSTLKKSIFFPIVSRAPRNVNPEVFYVLFVESLQMMHTVTLRFMCT